MSPLSLALCSLLAVGVLGLVAQQARAASSAPQTVHVADLPPWRGDLSTMTWLNPSEIGFSARGPLPTERWGVQTEPVRLSERHLLAGDADLPQGWHMSREESSSRLRSCHALAHQQTGRRVRLCTELDRSSGWFSRRLSGLFNSAAVYQVVVVSDRYLAFVVAEPGWIFFDMLDGVVLPWVLQINPNHDSYLYRSAEGEVLAEIPPDVHGRTGGDGRDRRADGVRGVVFGDLALRRAGLSPAVAEQIRALNQAR